MSDIPVRQPLPAVVNPLNWQMAFSTLPDGSRVCVLVLSQGALSMQLEIGLHDAEQLAQGLATTISQARSGLILPAGAQRTNGSSGG